MQKVVCIALIEYQIVECLYPEREVQVLISNWHLKKEAQSELTVIIFQHNFMRAALLVAESFLIPRPPFSKG